MTYEAILFDMDGVLVERTPAYVFNESVNKTFGAFGITNPKEEDYKLLRQTIDELPTYADRFEERYSVSAADLWEKRQDLNLQGQLEAMRNGEKQLYPDAEIIESLSLELAVVSNNQTPAVEQILEHYELDAHFSVRYGIAPQLEEIDRRKPNPVNLRRALDSIDVDSGLYVGDRETDVIAAANAGLDSAVVRREFNADVTFDTQPTYDIDSLEELANLVDSNGVRQSNRTGGQV